MIHQPHYKKSLIPYARKLRREMTFAERKLWSHIRRHQLGVKFRRQVPFDKYILDFYCDELQLNIELDGGQHYSDEGKKNDEKRDQYLRSQNITVLRFSDRDVMTNIEGVVKVVEMKIMELPGL